MKAVDGHKDKLLPYNKRAKKQYGTNRSKGIEALDSLVCAEQHSPLFISAGEL